ncbi:ATP-binding protein [Pseudomonas sp. 148P]|uniref:ATP-binding protein n=1 Tax=Pseudomonas ulcerans TaxID=3115852 RepID=A0ABU7HRU5_9PSED|nr:MULTISPECIES: ATP-binding protein [unclassified Pseudomonas]MEE1922127.1 ATP-binding protein [Pseudomonas sp. 147P]MEE1934213.1 ATP-binding protein [Pseudomonas sp. 148P]
MIVEIAARAFKSMVRFSVVDLRNFTCFVGLNGAGKSSILQLLDFASHLFRGDIDRWLSDRRWNASDLHSKIASQSNISLAVVIKTQKGRNLTWVASFNRSSMMCTVEHVIDESSGEKIFSLIKGRYSIQLPDGENFEAKVAFNYQGSILSTLKDDVLTPELREVKSELSSIRSLELLSPHLMRLSHRDTAIDIGVGGEKLSPFLYGIKGESRENLVSLLKQFYPAVVDFKVKQERAGWKKLSLIEEYDGKRVEVDARHINDGVLRILAILAQSASGKSLLLFDEIENGINPEVVEKLVDVLRTCGQQVIVTTHSPMILNYLPDDVAKQSVRFVYRSFDGGTKTVPLFEIPRMAEKLRIMGPGEAFVDTSLSLLAEECAEHDKAASEETKA